MRRRWEWPILDAMRGADWIAIWLFWLGGGFLCAVLPVMVITSNKHDHIHMAPLMLWTLIGWGAPLVAPIPFVIVPLLLDLAKLFIPKRITEPVREDLRSHHHHH